MVWNAKNTLKGSQMGTRWVSGPKILIKVKKPFGPVDGWKSFGLIRVCIEIPELLQIGAYRSDLGPTFCRLKFEEPLGPVYGPKIFGLIRVCIEIGLKYPKCSQIGAPGGLNIGRGKKMFFPMGEEIEMGVWSKLCKLHAQKWAVFELWAKN